MTGDGGLDGAGDPGLVSVVIPVRNGAATIGEQLEALARQDTQREYEVVVADNGSSDGTADVVRAFADRVPGLRVVDAGEAAGTNVARNAGTRAARGGSVLLCDADDVVDEHWLEALATGLETADAVGGPLERVLLNSNFVAAWGEPMPNAGIYEHMGFLPRPTGANAGFRRAAWHALGGFDERYVRGGTETEFFWRLQLRGLTVVEVPDAVVHYRLRGSTRALLGQYYTWGRQAPMLYRDFRDHGLVWRPGRAAVEWLWALSLLPRALWGPRGKKLSAVRQVVLRAGMVVGSIKYRILYL